MRLHEIRHHKKQEQQKRKTSQADTASIASSVDDVFTATNDAWDSYKGDIQLSLVYSVLYIVSLVYSVLYIVTF